MLAVNLREMCQEINKNRCDNNKKFYAFQPVMLIISSFSKSSKVLIKRFLFISNSINDGKSSYKISLGLSLIAIIKPY